MTARNKYGVHIVGYGSATGYGDALRLSVEKGQPFGFVKAMLTKGPAGEAKSYSKDTFTMYRCSIEDRDFPHTADGSWTWANSAECKASALDWVHKCAALWEGERENFDAHELFNEPNPVTSKIPQFLEWSGYCLDECERLGYNKIGWGSFSMGCPTEAQMMMMIPFVGELAKRGHVLCMHDGYWADDSSFQKSETDRYGERANSTLRYRWWWQKLLEAGEPIPQTAITELYAYGRYSPEYYTDWKWYLTELAKDDKLIGVATYILGDGDGIYRNIAGKPLASMVDQALTIDYASIVENAWDAPMPPTPNSVSFLDVPWFDQNNKVFADDSGSDCGAACLAMLLAQRGLDVTVDDVFMRTGAASWQPITFAQLQAAATNYGYTLEDKRNCTFEDLYALLNQKVAPILLVNAEYLNQPGKATPYMGAHYVTLVGHVHDGFMVHDPNNLPATIQPNLMDAWGNCHLQGNPDFAMLVLREGTPIPPPMPEPAGKVWRGLQLNNGDKNTTADWECITVGKLNAIKLTTDTRIEDLDFAATLVPADHILLRLYADLSDRIVAPHEFASWYTHYLARFVQIGGRYVEVHNEPNLTAEGLGAFWFEGAGFSHWLIAVLAELREKQPALKYGFPGLSPGGYIQNVRMDEAKFYAAARPATMQCDWIGVHCYWLDDAGMLADADGGHYRAYRDEGRPLIITEFSNPGPQPKTMKGQQYRRYYASLPNYIIGAYSFISSADNPAFASETWAGSEIPAIVGAP